jgi:hypothetical protein
MIRHRSQRERQLQRRLPAESRGTTRAAGRPLGLDDGHHVLERERLKATDAAVS